MLDQHPERIDMTALEQFSDYQEFRARSSGRRRSSQPSVESVDVLTGTPEEAIEAGYLQIREALASEIVGRLVTRDDRFFEDVVLDVLVAMGYGGSRDAAERVGRSGDGGIDGVIREDRLGLDKVYVQAKRWARDRAVGPREIREFLGALQDVEALKGVFITTSGFSSEARELAQRRSVILIDGLELAELMVDYGVGVTTLKTYQLRRIDEDYFGEAE
jgi:restriction system protein